MSKNKKMNNNDDLDNEIYRVLEKYISKNTNALFILSILTDHIIIMIQCLNCSNLEKLNMAKEISKCIINDIKNDPHPLGRKLN